MLHVTADQVSVCLLMHSACCRVHEVSVAIPMFWHLITGKPPCLVAVPTHFYKVVLAESQSRLPFGAPKVSVGAFVMPNDQIQPDMPLTAFSVPLEMLENVAGAVLTSLTCHCLLQQLCLLCLLQGIHLFPGCSKCKRFPCHSVHACLVAACKVMTASLHNSTCACAIARACNLTAVVQAACKLQMHST